MMRKTIVRSMTTSTVKGFKLEVIDGQATTKEVSLSVAGKLKDNEALKALKGEFGEGVQVSSIEHSEATYEISVDDFMKYAKKVD
mgnify:CR=1 FL=1